MYAGAHKHNDPEVANALKASDGTCHKAPELNPTAGSSSLSTYTYDDDKTMPVPEDFMMYRTTPIRHCRFIKSIKRTLEKRQKIWEIKVELFNPSEEFYKMSKPSGGSQGSELEEESEARERIGLDSDLVWSQYRMAAPSPFFVALDKRKVDKGGMCVLGGVEGKGEVNSTKWTRYTQAVP